MTLWVSPSKVVSGPAALVLYGHTGDPVSGSCDSYFYNLDILCSTGDAVYGMLKTPGC